MRVLMVEDEKYMVEAIEYVLKKNNYAVDSALDGETGLDYALSDVYDVIILDIMLPKLDGISILKKIREEKINTPIIMLTAKGEVNDKVLGLDNGADDYLQKPFQTDELLARLRALTRRKDSLNANNILKYYDIELNPHNITLYCNNKKFKLTLKESQVLELLLKKSERIVSKDLIISKLWNYEDDVENNTVEVYISFLRKKLLNLNSIVKIETIRGAGYKLNAVKDE
ncbi:MAG: response regulator transcription factor [Bacilli bacterium]|nr:response regulator transcription factor [Bacilli bacterium]